jgi:hypothetical protein
LEEAGRNKILSTGKGSLEIGHGEEGKCAETFEEMGKLTIFCYHRILGYRD